ncbi:MAG: DnaT-like ssDNA-binding domain-containing protein [Porticoccaceae bacterium]|nr:DnaT-like ssDNA-binding domain-containing protein [Porticoccaceae bacterium]MDG1474950.1 DnaT-like ssDNA-binding domain-containing protein [Porticoccaceae bacterium]
MSLIPEKPIVISPTLAATIGLEETVLLQLLQECISHGNPTFNSGFAWITVPADRLLSLAPFWRQDDVRRLTASLHEKGLLLIGGVTFTAHQDFRFAFNEDSVASAPNHLESTRSVPAPKPSSAKTIGSTWQPSEDALRQLSQLGVTREFAHQQVPQFVAYWRDRNIPRHSWESKYIKEVWRQWQQAETSNNRRRKEVSVTSNWRPSVDALDILVSKGGINTNFVEDAIPEFILYWRDRGAVSSTWDSKFVQHVRRQWQFYSGMMEQESMPRVIGENWQPKERVYDVLQMANIDRPFAEQRIPEFVLYWQENGSPQSAWNTRFLQYVKRQWAYQSKLLTDTSNGKQQGYSKGRIRDRSIIDALSDRSWAS